MNIAAIIAVNIRYVLSWVAVWPCVGAGFCVSVRAVDWGVVGVGF